MTDDYLPLTVYGAWRQAVHDRIHEIEQALGAGNWKTAEEARVMVGTIRGLNESLGLMHKIRTKIVEEDEDDG